MKNYYGFIAILVLFVAGCFLMRKWADTQVYVNNLCGHMKTISVVKIGYAFDGPVDGMGCFAEWDNGKKMTTFWNVGDCLDRTPVEVDYPDYECL